MKIKQLSELEQEVMGVVWSLGKCTIREVVEETNKKKNLAYTTIATILERLHEKGLVKKDTSSFTVIFTPKQTKEEFSQRIARTLLDKFFGSFGDAAIASFAKSIDRLPKEKKEYFLELLTQYEKNK
jgi:predicted transcriptional regulator